MMTWAARQQQLALRQLVDRLRAEAADHEAMKEYALRRQALRHAADLEEILNGQ